QGGDGGEGAAAGVDGDHGGPGHVEGDADEADVGVVAGVPPAGQPVVPPGQVEAAAVGHRLVVVPHVRAHDHRVPAELRRERRVGQAQVGAEDHRVAGHHADGPVAVDQVVGRQVVAAVVPEDAHPVAVGGYGQGRLPLVGPRHVVGHRDRVTPG